MNLKQKAIILHACQEGIDRWSDDLIGMYIQGIDWCLKNKYPTIADMLPYDVLCSENGVFNNKQIDLLLTGDTYVANNCIGSVEINDYNVSRIYTSLDTKLSVSVKDNAYLIIDCYDNSNIQLSIGENAQCYVWQYGNSVIQVLSGSAKIVKK